ncbi:MAG TPA: sugar isomerase domain-containing protein [Streptosporangiaceae bacterium]|jgi:uncharacterized phosphosugar-binding protein
MTDFSEDFGLAAREHLRRVEEHNADAVEVAAGRMLDAVRADRLIHTAGSGHSLAMVMESFYRAGGLACVRPLLHPALFPLFGAQVSTRIERVPGLAASIVAQAGAAEGDVAFVFSTSGLNAYPVEVAESLSAAGAYVVALAARPHMDTAAPRVHAKLGDVADLVIDTMVPPGDAVFPGTSGRTAPISSLVNVYLWDLLLVALSRQADAAAVRLPLWQSSNIPGGDEANAEHFTRYRPAAPML